MRTRLDTATEDASTRGRILRHGADAFAALGHGASRGTKVFALAGKIRRGGLIEVPMGVTLREIVEEIAGGVHEGRTFKAVQIGGPSGGCLPASLADTPVDYEALAATGAIMGSGGLVVLDDRDCMVDMARFFLRFTQAESCGKCTFDEVHAGLSPDAARREALRCLTCGCAKADCCDLRRLANELGADPYRYLGARRRFAQDRTHPEVVYEPGKCIMCDACVRIAIRAGEPIGLATVGRGFDVSVGVPFERPLLEGLTTAARECAQACPTGALAFAAPRACELRVDLRRR